MIVDHIRNRKLYYGLGERYKKALEYFAEYVPGKTESYDDYLEGEKVFIRIRPLMTKPMEACFLESHRNYADIHYVAMGTEKIGYADVKNLKEVSYDVSADAAVLEGSCDILTLPVGYFMITFADDAHMPCIMCEKPEHIEKLIAKIKL